MAPALPDPAGLVAGAPPAGPPADGDDVDPPLQAARIVTSAIAPSVFVPNRARKMTSP